MTKFGKAFRDEFLLEKGYLPLNHGSFGVYPKALRSIITGFQERCEAHPDRFLRFEMPRLIEENLQLIGKLIHCDYKDIGFVQNASVAANTVLRSFPFNEGDKIIYFHTAYATVNNTLKYLQDHAKVELVEIELKLPLENEEILDLTRDTIKRENAKGGSKIVMAVMDAIISLPGVRFPFEAVTQLVQDHDILSFVDGAHVLGQIPIDIQECHPDFFFSNCHKWMYAPRGCAILYVAKHLQGLIHPTSISLSYQFHTAADDDSSFYKELFPGTMDVTSYLAVKAALEYRESIGGEDAIRDYTHDLAVRGGALVAEMLGTRVLENSTKSFTANMVNVELPAFNSSKSAAELSAYFLETVIYKYHTMVPIFQHNNSWWVRLSAQVYTDLDDFKQIGDILLDLVKQLN